MDSRDGYPNLLKFHSSGCIRHCIGLEAKAEGQGEQPTVKVGGNQTQAPCLVTPQNWTPSCQFRPLPTSLGSFH